MCRLLGNNYAEAQHATFLCKRSMGVVWRAAIGSPGYSCEVGSRPYGSALLVVHCTKTLSFAAWLERRLAMLPNVILLVFAALASSFLWWCTRLKICRRCQSRIRRWATVCHVCGAEQEDSEQSTR